MPMMRFDDLDVVAIIQHLRRLLQQLKHNIYAHAHIRREHDADVAAGVADDLLLLGGKTGGTDDEIDFFGAAIGNVRHRAFGAGKVDQRMRAIHRLKAIGYRRAARRTDQLAGIFAQKSAAGTIQRRGQAHIRRLADDLD